MLKQLQTVYAWRGNLVDKVISDFVAKALLKKTIPSVDDTMQYAMTLADSQITFSRSKEFRRQGMTKSAAGDSYSALYDLEYGGGINDESLRAAKDDIRLALRNLLASDLMEYVARQNRYLVAQRQIRFDFAGVQIKCTPDLIVFFDDESPLVIDWKVHAFANTDFHVQLGLYGIALSRMNHQYRDFPSDSTYAPESIRLIEYQLLKNEQRRHLLNVEGIADIEDYVYHSITQIKREIDDRPLDSLHFTDLRSANYVDTCSGCKFRSLCGRSLPKQSLLFEVV